MDYMVIRDKTLLEDTCYFEFLPGRYQGKCWTDSSIFVSEKSIFVFEDLLDQTIEGYDHYTFMEISKDQILKLIAALEKRAGEISSGNLLN